VAQGVLALAAPLEEADLDELCRPSRGVAPFLLVLDGVTDPHNVGSLLRSAECAGATGAVLPRHRAAHITPTVAKVAAGAVEHLAIAVVPGIPAALSRMSELGVTTVGLDADAGHSLFELEVLSDDRAGGVALVMGAEGSGLGALTRRRCTVLAAIPQRGKLGSINVAAAGAVACFELARQRGLSTRPR
jgi:23S rRNA (guanosine2251-2'-O)-methyltransferase